MSRAFIDDLTFALVILTGVASYLLLMVHLVRGEMGVAGLSHTVAQRLRSAALSCLGAFLAVVLARFLFLGT